MGATASKQKIVSKIPVTIVTGFLGSGKTTLITNLLRHTPDQRLAVLVNEFGEVSIDGALLRSASKEGCGAEIHDLPNGCICCTVQDDFLPTMKRLQARKNEIDHVLIETSGLALPTPVMSALSWPEIRNDFQLDAVLTVVDTPELLGGGLDAGAAIPGAADGKAATVPHLDSVESILCQQLENADVVILNKIDELDDGALLRAEEMVRARAPRVRFLELAHHAELDTRLCMGLKLHDDAPPAKAHGHSIGGHGHHHGPVETLPLESAAPLENQAQFDGHAHSGIGAHMHGDGTHAHFHEHDPGWQSFVLHSHEPQDAETLKTAVREATQREPILRAKGFAAIAGKAQPLVVQAVRSRVQAYFSTEPAAHDHGAEIVFIGYHPNRENVERAMSDATGTAWH